MKEKEEEIPIPIPPDDYRCKRSDGRTWRCKKPVIAGKFYCDSHIYRSSKTTPLIQDNYVSAPESLKDSESVRKSSRARVRPGRYEDSDPGFDVGLLGFHVSRDFDVAARDEGFLGSREEGDESRVVLALRGGNVAGAREEVGLVGCKGSRDEDVCAGINVVSEEVRLARGNVRVPREGSRYVVALPVVNVAVACQEVGLIGPKASSDVPMLPGINGVSEEVRLARENVRVPREGSCDVGVSVAVASEEVGLIGPNASSDVVSEVVGSIGSKASCDGPVGPGINVVSEEVRLARGNVRVPRDVPVRPDINVVSEEVRLARGNVRVPRDASRSCVLPVLPAGSIGIEPDTAPEAGTLVSEEVKLARGNVSVAREGLKVVREKVAVARDEVRCSRNDGRTWRCKREVVKGYSMCEIHLSKASLRGPRVKKPAVMGKIDTPTVNKPRMKRPNVEREAMQVPKEGVEDDWRCKRTDGRGWRCKRRVSDGKTMCELHYEQGKLRQKRITVPDSMKLQRGEGPGGGDRIERKLKRKRALQLLENNSDKGMKRMKAELIRVFVRREIIELNKKSEMDSDNTNVGEITMDLPYGFMAIAPPPCNQFLENVECSGIKVGVNCDNSLIKRRFRSKNIEPLPVGPLKAVPFAENVRKPENRIERRKCHWCQDDDKSSLTKCLSCRKRFFCAQCIKERDTDPEDVKVKCPACCGICDCMACCATQTKEILNDTFKGSKFHQLQYLIKLLLPILERINQEQSIETEAEARFKGQDLSEVEIRQADVGYKDQCRCNKCKSPILDFHRSCPNCSYNLCLICCREYSQSGCLRGTENSISQTHSVTKAHLPGLRVCSEKVLNSSSTHSTGNADLAAVASLSESLPCVHISCPPMEFGGCDNSLLDLRCIFPLNWTKELEISAEESASGHELPQTTDDFSHCSLCASTIQAADRNKETLEASRRTLSHDNFIYCPNSSDDHHNMLAHFQKHWRRGHPVIVRNVLQCASALSLDPMAIFCRRLEDNGNDSVSRENDGQFVNCTDWYEVEIGTRESFARSLEEESTHRQHKTLRVKAKLSSTFSKKLLKNHYSQIVHELPLQEYTDPKSGLLNITGNLPEHFPEFKLDPHLCISFGSREVVARGKLLTRLHHNPYDMVNILTHVADATCSTEQLNKVSLLMRQNNKEEQRPDNRENVEAGTRDKIPSEVVALGNEIIGDKLHAKLQCSDNDSDTSDGQYKSSEQMYCLEERLESSGLSDKTPSSESCGARWDVFRRQDVPKLLEYMEKYVEELSFSCDLPKNVVHPIFDGSFYLDSTHKMQLKEEYDIEPWTFNQCVGEAVFVPAGCPYQIRNIKSCINIASGFISAENASECIKLVNDIRTLPDNHKAKEGKLEVEKMTICSIDEAVKEIYRLRSE